MAEKISLRKKSSTVISEYTVSKEERRRSNFTWVKTGLPDFNETIVTWNAKRPDTGSYLIEISLLTKQGWSPFFDYVEWQSERQQTFQLVIEDHIFVKQDCISIKGFATGFQIRISATKECLFDFWRLFTCTTNLQNFPCKSFIPPNERIALPLPHLSQFSHDIPIKDRICSPTSTTAVLRYLKPSLCFDAPSFAERVVDHHFDIYGNWVLNVSQASAELGPSWKCFVARLSGLNDLFFQLQENIPVVISILGPIKGSPRPYESGHLIVILGFDPLTNEFLTMDPAFPKETKSPIRYRSKDLEEAWKRRFFLAYIFYKEKL